MNAQVYEKMEAAIAMPSFLEMLSRNKATQQQQHPQQTQQQDGHAAFLPAESQVLGFEQVEEPPSSSSNGGGASGAYEEFTLVEKADAVDALAHYIAQFITQCPEAHALTPKQLQAALRTTLQSMKKSRFRRMCTMGQYAYRWGALSYSAVQMWQNPWLVQAVITILYTASKVILRRLL